MNRAMIARTREPLALHRSCNVVRLRHLLDTHNLSLCRSVFDCTLE
jgi:hypothetical protein